MTASLAMIHRRRLPLANLQASVALTGSICLAACLAIASEPLAGWLEYDRAAIAGGQWWRVATGHLVHWSTDHFFWDTLVFGVLGGVCERRNRGRFCGCLMLSAVAISAAIAYLLPDVSWYRGLSGIDSALFTFVAVCWLRDAWRDRDRIQAAPILAALFGFVAKMAFEIVTGTTLFVDSTDAGFVPLPLVHAVGGMVGAAVGLISAAE